MRLIDLDVLKIERMESKHKGLRRYACGWNGVVHLLENTSTIDLEALSIVKELRERLNKSEEISVQRWKMLGEMAEINRVLHHQLEKYRMQGGLIMPLTEFDKIYKQAIETYGKESQIMMVFEEMSELQKELCKNLRGKDNKQEIAEEIADVTIMLNQLLIIFDCYEDASEFLEAKTKRLKRRLNRESEE